MSDLGYESREFGERLMKGETGKWTDEQSSRLCLSAGGEGMKYLYLSLAILGICWVIYGPSINWDTVWYWIRYVYHFEFM